MDVNKLLNPELYQEFKARLSISLALGILFTLALLLCLYGALVRIISIVKFNKGVLITYAAIYAFVLISLVVSKSWIPAATNATLALLCVMSTVFCYRYEKALIQETLKESEVYIHSEHATTNHL